MGYLDLAREKHDSNGTTERLGRQVSGELSLNRATVSVVSGDLAPNGSDLGTSLQRLGLVDVSNSLAQIELSVLLGVDTLDLQDGVIGLLVTLTLRVTSHNSLGVESARLTSSGSLRFLGNSDHLVVEKNRLSDRGKDIFAPTRQFTLTNFELRIHSF